MKFTPCWLDTPPNGPGRSLTAIGRGVVVSIGGAGLTRLSVALLPPARVPRLRETLGRGPMLRMMGVDE